MTTDYTDLEAVRRFNLDDDMAEDLVTALITAVSRAIDKHCRRVFYTVTAGRVYDWEATNQLRLRDDLVSLTSVTTSAGQTLTTVELTVEPRSGPPYSRIRVKDGLGVSIRYATTRSEALTVTGVWGYKAAVPDLIALACQAWVSEIYAQADTRGMESMSGGGIRASMRKLEEGPPPDVKGWLSTFVKPTRIAVLGVAV